MPLVEPFRTATVTTATKEALLVRVQGDAGAGCTHVDAGVAVGLCDDEAELRRLVALYVEQGYRRIKCKIEPGNDEGVVRAARDEAGDAVELAADANGSYTLLDTDALEALS